MKKFTTVAIVLAVIAGVLVLTGPFYILEEGQQALLIRFGQVIGQETTAGLKFKVPMLDNVAIYSKKILSWDGEPQRVPTKENQFIWVDTTARWRIADPTKFYSSVTTMEAGFSRLDDLIDSIVRTTISGNFLREAVRNSNIINITKAPAPVAEKANIEEAGLQEIAKFTNVQVKQDEIVKGRVLLSRDMLEAARVATAPFGIEIIDIIVRQIRYSDDLTESVYQRMIKDRNQIARAYRSYGEGKKKEWLGKLENEKKGLLSAGYSEAEKLRGTADATAARTYSEAYSADPDFFAFWRSIESYRSTLPVLKKTLTTDMDYFRFLYNPGR